jgi:hypothetical protein
MKLIGIKPLFFWQRAILILGALGSLCVSDSAGPRLLPLPNPTPAEATVSFSAENFASPAPQSGERTAYMAMIAGLQYRPRDSHQQTQPATLAPEQASNVPPIEIQIVRHLNRDRRIKAVSLSIPIGRAPPRLA